MSLSDQQMVEDSRATVWAEPALQTRIFHWNSWPSGQMSCWELGAEQGERLGVDELLRQEQGCLKTLMSEASFELKTRFLMFLPFKEGELGKIFSFFLCFLLVKKKKKKIQANTNGGFHNRRVFGLTFVQKRKRTNKTTSNYSVVEPSHKQKKKRTKERGSFVCSFLSFFFFSFCFCFWCKKKKKTKQKGVHLCWRWWVWELNQTENASFQTCGLQETTIQELNKTIKKKHSSIQWKCCKDLKVRNKSFLLFLFLFLFLFLLVVWCFSTFF